MKVPESYSNFSHRRELLALLYGGPPPASFPRAPVHGAGPTPRGRLVRFLRIPRGWNRPHRERFPAVGRGSSLG